MRTLYLSFLKQYNKIIQSFSLYFSQSASVDTFKLSCVDKKNNHENVSDETYCHM